MTPAEPPTLLYLVKQLELVIRAKLDELVRPTGLTTLQYTALTVLERHPDLTAAELARRSFTTAQSAADLVGALQSHGLIQRHRDPTDRRRLVLALTEPGQALLGELREPVTAVEAQMIGPLSEREAEHLRVVLDRCRAALEPRADRNRPGLPRTEKRS